MNEIPEQVVGYMESNGIKVNKVTVDKETYFERLQQIHKRSQEVQRKLNEVEVEYLAPVKHQEVQHGSVQSSYTIKTGNTQYFSVTSELEIPAEQRQ